MYKDLKEYLPEVIQEVEKQMVSDDNRWGGTWKMRTVTTQVDRIYDRFKDYKDQFDNADVPIPWMKIICLAIIGYVREKYESSNG